MGLFEETAPSLETYWRAIILFGRNVASYKFALGQTIIDLSEQGKSFITLEDLADPFARHISRHLEYSTKQTTSRSSKFLDVCQAFTEGRIGKEQLIDETVRRGFNNVIDAFHVVNGSDVPYRFFIDRRKDSRAGIELTDHFFRLSQSTQFENLPNEVEARWRLVEAAWELQLPPRMLIRFNPDTEVLEVSGNWLRRCDITSCRDALNGYQKGKCFYCFGDISVQRCSPALADVDHFVPRVLLHSIPGASLDGVWNLVLACRQCNRGVLGKSARLPELSLLERLHNRNEFLINSHHPLRETLLAQTGGVETERVSFLKTVYDESRRWLVTTWMPEQRGRPVF